MFEKSACKLVRFKVKNPNIANNRRENEMFRQILLAVENIDLQVLWESPQPILRFVAQLVENKFRNKKKAEGIQKIELILKLMKRVFGNLWESEKEALLREVVVGFFDNQEIKPVPISLIALHIFSRYLPKRLYFPLYIIL